MPIPELAEIPVRSAAELTRRWAELLEPPRFAARSLWVTWFGADGRQVPIVMPIDELPDRPSGTTLSGLLQLHEAVVTEHLGGCGHLAMALCRPGRSGPTHDDLAWAVAIREAVAESVPDVAHVRTTWSLHLAAGGAVRALVDAPDGLCASVDGVSVRPAEPSAQEAPPRPMHG
jgi:hypothetical protein